MNSLRANLPLWRELRREEARAVAANAGSELLTPTHTRSWKVCNVHFSGIHTGISTRLPSIYRVWQVLRRWLMMTLFWGLSRWQSMTPNLSLICTPCIHTTTCTHILFIVFLTQSSEILHTHIFPPNGASSSSSLSCDNQPGSQVAGGLGSWCYFMAHESGRILQWNM